MKNILTVFCFIFSFGFAQAQEVSEDTLQTARNSLFVELGGSTYLYSINYDRIFYSSKWLSSSARVGVFYNWMGRGSFGVPVEVNGLIGKGKHFLEIGVGGSYTYGVEGVEWRTPNTFGKEGIERFSAVFATGRLGYRFQKPEGGFFFRAAYTPTARLFTDNPYYGTPIDSYHEERDAGFTGFTNWFGISVGRSF
jgi:hypothetical protein